MPSQKPRIVFVTEKSLIEKLKYISDAENRSLSKEVERLCKIHIQNWEKEHGIIDIA